MFTWKWNCLTTIIFVHIGVYKPCFLVLFNIIRNYWLLLQKHDIIKTMWKYISQYKSKKNSRDRIHNTEVDSLNLPLATAAVAMGYRMFEFFNKIFVLKFRSITLLLNPTNSSQSDNLHNLPSQFLKNKPAWKSFPQC